jgi:hypothetical protein
MTVALMTRKETASALAVSVSILAKAATDVIYGQRAEANRVLPPVHQYISNRAFYLADDVMAVIQSRKVAQMSGRLRARKIL